MTDDDIRKAYNEWWALQNVGDHSPRDAWLAYAEKMGAELEASKEKERGSYELVRQANMKCDMMFKDLAQSSKREKELREALEAIRDAGDKNAWSLAQLAAKALPGKEEYWKYRKSRQDQDNELSEAYTNTPDGKQDQPTDGVEKWFCRHCDEEIGVWPRERHQCKSERQPTDEGKKQEVVTHIPQLVGQCGVDYHCDHFPPCNSNHRRG